MREFTSIYKIYIQRIMNRCNNSCVTSRVNWTSDDPTASVNISLLSGFIIPHHVEVMRETSISCLKHKCGLSWVWLINELQSRSLPKSGLPACCEWRSGRGAADSCGRYRCFMCCWDKLSWNDEIRNKEVLQPFISPERLCVCVCVCVCV